MNGNAVVSKIVSVAQEAVRDGDTLSRADLVYALKDCGVTSDSPELSGWLWNAYESGGDCVRQAFVINASGRSVVEDIALARMLSSDDGSGAMALFSRSSCNCKKTLQALRSELQAGDGDPEGDSGASLVSELIGTSGIESSRRRAKNVFERYSRLVGCYEKAKGGVRDVVHDFVSIRTDLEKRYRRHVMELVDVFGDAVKAVDPKLFDYDSVQWIDTKSLLQKRELQYSGIASKCGALIGEVSDSFKNAVQSAARGGKLAGGGDAALLLAGVEMVLHYAGASMQTSEVDSQVVALRNDVKHDGMVIQGDLMRLAKVYKKINDLHLPRAEAFYRNEDEVFTGVVKNLLDAVYASPEGHRLRVERERLLETRQNGMDELAVVREDIEHYRDFLQECRTALDDVLSQYEEARSRKPQRPLFDFGGGYSRKLYEWNTVCGPVVKKYQRLTEDMKMAEEDLAAAERRLPDLERGVAKVTRELDDLAIRLRAHLSVQDSVKAAIFPHLKDMVGLLRVAKSILESGLSVDEVRVVDVADSDSLSLPVSCKEQIAALGESLSAICEATPDITDREAEACKSMVGAFASWMRLEETKEAERLNESVYAAELERLRDEFKKSVSDIEQSAVALQKVLAQINLASTPEERKRGMMALADVGDGWTDADWAEFFSGNRKIEV